MSEVKSSSSRSKRTSSRPKAPPAVEVAGTNGPEPARATGAAGEVGAAGGAAPTLPEPPATPAAAIRVTAKVDGFRRAGRSWSTAGDLIQVADLGEGQLQALRDDPALIVQDL